MSLISYLTSFQKNGIENNWLTEETPLLLPPSSPYNTPSSSSPSSPSHNHQQYPRKNSYNKRFLNKHVLHLAISVPHKSQLQDWDCGLACASMVCAALGIPSCEPIDMLNAVTPLNSIWTIDLAYLLNQYRVLDFTYYTTYIGVNYQHSTYNFYKDFTKDKARIHGLFAKASEVGVRLVQMEIKLENLQSFLFCPSLDDLYDHHQFVCIILINARLLGCKLCGDVDGSPVRVLGTQVKEARYLTDGFWQRVKRFCGSCSTTTLRKSEKKEEEFIGHYIVLFAYDSRCDLFYYRDPGLENEICCVSSSVLEKSRCSRGTDHDTIIVKIK